MSQAESENLESENIARRETVEGLTDILMDQYPLQVENRGMGLRSQFPICGLDGSAGDTGMLWTFLKGDGFVEYREENGMLSALHGERYSYSVAPGRGIIEIQIPIQDSLLDMQTILLEATERLKVAAERWNKKVLGYGGLPLTEPTPECLTHKFHYFSLLRKIREPYLFRGLQATNRFWINTNRTELLDQMNWFHLLSPLFAMWSANTPVFAGEDGGYPSNRWDHQTQLDVGDGRWQIVHVPYSGMDEWVFHSLHQPHLLLRDEEGWLNPAEGVFGQFCQDKMPSDIWTDFTDHLDTFWTMTHPVFNSDQALPSSIKDIVGLQVAETEQQGVDKTLAMGALLLGCSEQGQAIVEWLEDLVPDPPAKREFGLRPNDILQRNLDYTKDVWSPFQAHWERFLKQGRMYPEPFFGCVDGIFTLARRGLETRGLGEERLLEPLENTIRQNLNPTSEMRRTWILDGISGLVERVQV